MDRHNPSKKIIKGVIPPIITPLLDNEDIDEKSLRKIVDVCIENKLGGIFVAGSGGETMSLTQRQRNKAIKIVIEHTCGRIPVLCGVMDTGTRRVIENIKEFEQLGGEYAVVTPPFYIRNTHQDEIIRHFEEISKSTLSSILIYNIPANTQVNILPDTVEKLSHIDNIIGLKESSGSWIQFQKCLYLFRNTDFILLQGITEMAAPSLLLGADGYIPIFSVIFPKIFIELFEKAKNNDIEGAIVAQNIINSINALEKYSTHKDAPDIKNFIVERTQYNPALMAIVKYAGSQLGYCSKKVTLPCREMTEAEEERVKDVINYYRHYLTA